jgi:germination protein M
MKKIYKKHKRKILTTAVILLLVTGALLLYLLGSRGGEVTVSGLRVFYYNPSDGLLSSNAVTLVATNPEAQVNAMFAHFARQDVWPEGLNYIYLELYGDLVGVVFPPEYRSIPPLEEALFRAALVLTLTELPFVERVLVWIHGEGDKPYIPFAEWLRDESLWDTNAVAVENANTVSNNPSITAGVMRQRTIVLYFVRADGEGLITETLVDEYIDVHRLAETKLQYLIAGPSIEGAMRIIPPETRIRMINYDPGHRSLYVDFSIDFSSRFIGNHTLAALMLQSIVNTLTLEANSEWQTRVHQVYFLINSERLETFHGVSNFHSAFRYDHDITLVEDIEEPYNDDNDEENGDDIPVGPRGDDEE